MSKKFNIERARNSSGFLLRHAAGVGLSLSKCTWQSLRNFELAIAALDSKFFETKPLGESDTFVLRNPEDFERVRAKITSPIN